VDGRDKPGHDESRGEKCGNGKKEKSYRDEICDQNADQSYLQTPPGQFDCSLHGVFTRHQICPRD
jgi:hypothetical protein